MTQEIHFSVCLSQVNFPTWHLSADALREWDLYRHEQLRLTCDRSVQRCIVNTRSRANPVPEPFSDQQHPWRRLW